MARLFDVPVVLAMARRTFRQTVESPIAYVVAIFFYGFVGGIFGLNYFLVNQASIISVGQISPWVLWFVIPALTMGLIAEEIRGGTFEVLLSTVARSGSEPLPLIVSTLPESGSNFCAGAAGGTSTTGGSS